MILQSEPDIEVVGEATDGESAVRQAIELRPDVTVMDIRMPGLDGIEATRLLAGRHVADPLRIVVVTTYDIDENATPHSNAPEPSTLTSTASSRRDPHHRSLPAPAPLHSAVQRRADQHMTGQLLHTRDMAVGPRGSTMGTSA
jgi:DNA-binding NarL/FixJ family response regulator